MLTYILYCENCPKKVQCIFFLNMKVNLIFNNIGLTKEKQKENIGHRQLHIIYFSYLRENTCQTQLYLKNSLFGKSYDGMMEDKYKQPRFWQ